MTAKIASKTRHNSFCHEYSLSDFTDTGVIRVKNKIGTYYLIYTLFLTFAGSQGISDAVSNLPLTYLIATLEVIFLAMFAFIYFSYRLIIEGWINKWVLRFIVFFNAVSPAYFFYRFIYHAPSDQSMLKIYYIVNVLIPVSISLLFLKVWIKALREFVPETYKFPQIN